MNVSKALEVTIQDLPHSFKVKMTDETDEVGLKKSLISEIVYNSRYYDEMAVDPTSLEVEDGEASEGFKTFIVSLRAPA